MTYTLLDYRRRTYSLLTSYHKSTCTSGSSTTTLEDTTWPVKSTVNSSQFYKDYFLFRPNAILNSDKVRAVSIYTPANGYLQPDLPWTNNPYNAGVGEVYELCGLIPPIQDNNSDLHTLINNALRRMLVTVEFTITVVSAGAIAGQENSGDTRALLPSWFKYRWQLRQAGYLSTIENRMQIDPYRRVVWGVVDQDGDNFYFNHYPHQFGTDSIIYCRAVRTADTLCAPSGGTLGTQTGLTLDTDIAKPDVEWVAAATAVEAWDEFGHQLDAEGQKRALITRAEAAKRLTRETRKNVRIPPLRLRIPKLMGPPQRDIGHITYGFMG